jgi:hypothetical protein
MVNIHPRRREILLATGHDTRRDVDMKRTPILALIKLGAASAAPPSLP